MSGLETAIRNALDRSDRADRDTRARIYQSARQALDAGLRKQGVSDRLVIMQQSEMLERKIHEIEMEEVARVSEPEPEPMVELDPEPRYAARPMPVEAEVVSPAAASRAQPAAAAPEIAVRGETRSASPAAAPVFVPEAEIAGDDMGGFTAARAERTDAPLRAKPEKPSKKDKAPRRRSSSSDTGLDVSPERTAKPRKRRGFISHLLTWVITLGVVGGGCWYFYKTGLVQSIVEEAMKAANQSGGGNGQGGNFDPRRAFSDEWREIFAPSRVAELKVGGQAKAEAVAASEGQAVRIQSAVPTDGGDVAVEVPVDVLREMAGKSSTVALTLQSGQNNSAQLSVRCDFGSLGSCSRHRFTATQEKLEAIFRVSFDRSLAPNRPGRLIINSGIDGADRQVLLYSIRILPGQ